jgi:hypothetical protein
VSAGNFYEPVLAVRLTSIGVRASRSCDRCGVDLGECRPTTRHCLDCSVQLRFEQSLSNRGIDITRIPDEELDRVSQMSRKARQNYWDRLATAVAQRDDEVAA